MGGTEENECYSLFLVVLRARICNLFLELLLLRCIGSCRLLLIVSAIVQRAQPPQAARDLSHIADHPDAC